MLAWMEIVLLIFVCWLTYVGRELKTAMCDFVFVSNKCCSTCISPVNQFAGLTSGQFNRFRDVVPVNKIPLGDTVTMVGVSDEQPGPSYEALNGKTEANSFAEKHVEELGEYFERLIDWIPPEQYGFDVETRELLKQHKHETVESKLTPKDKKQLGKQGKKRLAQMDTDQLHTVSATLMWLDTHESESHKSNQRLTNGVMTESEGNNANQQQPCSREELLERLQDKIKAFRKQRHAKDAASYQEMHRLKRRVSKLKLKQKRRSAKEELKLEKLKALPDADDSEPVQSTDSAVVKTQTKKKQKAGETMKTNRRVVNAAGQMVYSKFDFAASPGAPATKGKLRKGELSGKDYKRLLEKAQKKNEKLAELEKRDPAKAAELKSKDQWTAAMLRVDGVKVKDDPLLLKKNLKRKEQRKKQNQKKWQDRHRNVQNQQQQRQDKRQQNLKKRKDNKQQKRVDVAKKKGRYVPGF